MNRSIVTAMAGIVIAHFYAVYRKKIVASDINIAIVMGGGNGARRESTSRSSIIRYGRILMEEKSRTRNGNGNLPIKYLLGG